MEEIYCGAHNQRAIIIYFRHGAGVHWEFAAVVLILCWYCTAGNLFSIFSNFCKLRGKEFFREHKTFIFSEWFFLTLPSWNYPWIVAAGCAAIVLLANKHLNPDINYYNKICKYQCMNARTNKLYFRENDIFSALSPSALSPLHYSLNLSIETVMPTMLNGDVQIFIRANEAGKQVNKEIGYCRVYCKGYCIRNSEHVILDHTWCGQRTSPCWRHPRGELRYWWVSGVLGTKPLIVDASVAGFWATVVRCNLSLSWISWSAVVQSSGCHVALVDENLLLGRCKTRVDQADATDRSGFFNTAYNNPSFLQR